MRNRMEGRGRGSWAALFVLALGACGPRPEPVQGPPVVISPLTLEVPPVYALLGYRERLNLTSQQVVSLDSVAAWTREADRPLIEQLEERGYDPLSGARGVRLATDDSTRALAHQIEENHRRAVEGVRSVLTPEQQTTTCDLFRSERERLTQERRGQRRDDMAERRRMGRRGAALDSLAARAAAGRPWSWCAPPAATREQARGNR